MWRKTLFIICVFISTNLFAEELNQETSKDKLETSSHEETKSKILRRITVAGENNSVAGSSHFLKKDEMEKAKVGFDDVHTALREIPGVNVQEEEGFGLRPNIGLRGATTERSENITLMEDSVLAAPAPYSAPSAYFFPPIGRMESLEVLKGAGQIKYGPRTVGGSLNMFSTSIPDDFNVSARVQGGENNSQLLHLNAGESYKYAGWMLETYQLHSDGFKDIDNSDRDSGFDLQDYVGKIRLNTDKNHEFYQELEIKINNYNQNSDDTYLGLTNEDFKNNPFRRYTASELDNIEVKHNQLMARHYIDLGKGMDLTTTFYKNDTERAWYKLDGVNGSSIGSILNDPSNFVNEMDYIRGNANTPEDVYLTIRNNNREYESKGIQTVFGSEFEIGETEHNLEFGARFHQDSEDRFQRDDQYAMINGKLSLVSRGIDGSQDNRIREADAWAFYLQDEVKINKLTITPGIRYENIDLQQTKYASGDFSRTGIDRSVERNNIDVFIPGIGAYYDLTETIGLFASVHKGFSSPTPGSGADVEEEESINYETGLNYHKNSFKSELVLFYNDYDNLLGADTLAAGGQGTGDSFNAGKAKVKGAEVSVAYDFNEIVESRFTLPTKLAYTYTDAEFRETFDSSFFGSVNAGDALPYIAENQAFLRIGIGQDDWAVNLATHYLDAMPTAAGEAGLSSQKTDARTIFDLTGEVEIAKGTRLFATVQNLFDEEYIVAQRPAGARPGLPRTFFAGLKFNLN